MPHSAILACILSHLNDVNVYASENGMDAALLSTLFAESILRPRHPATNGGKAETTVTEDNTDAEKEYSRALVEDMISNVDALIDEATVKALAEP